jgi:uncharacterized protein YceK
MRTLIIIATIVIVVIALCALQGCGAYMGTKMRIEKNIDSVYCPTVMEWGLGTMCMIGIGPDGSNGKVTYRSIPLGLLMYLDLPITATTDTLMLPWDIYILTHPVKGK